MVSRRSGRRGANRVAGRHVRDGMEAGEYERRFPLWLGAGLALLLIVTVFLLFLGMVTGSADGGCGRTPADVT